MDLIIQKVESINIKHWEKSYENISLKEQAILITEIKNLTRQKLKSFKQIKQNYVYAESQILVNRDEINSKKVPSSRKARRTEILNYQKLQKSFQDKIAKFLDQETIRFQILKHKSQQSKKWLINNPTKTVQPILPLANQLFKNSNNKNLSIKLSNTRSSKNSKQPLNKNVQSPTKSAIQTKTSLPDWI